MRDQEFIDNCRKVVEARGKKLTAHLKPDKTRHKALGHAGPSRTFKLHETLVYEDDRIFITASTSTAAIVIERKAWHDPDNPHLRVSNPCIFIQDNGKSIRWHGEYGHLKPHVEKVLEEMEALERR